MSADLRAKIVAIPCWYHRIALPDGLVTPGWAPPLAPERHQLPEDVTGLRILDVGAWDSYWTFDALERGAEEVLAIDDFSDNLDEGHNVSRPKWETFNLCRDALGHSEERCQRKEMNILISRQKMSAASMSCFFGALYHLPHPLLALDKLATIGTGTIPGGKRHMRRLRPVSRLRTGLRRTSDGHEFYPDKQLGDNSTNWWAPTLDCLSHIVRAAGFDEVHCWTLTDAPKEIPHCHGFARGVKKDGRYMQTIDRAR